MDEQKKTKHFQIKTFTKINYFLFFKREYKKTISKKTQTVNVI